MYNSGCQHQCGKGKEKLFNGYRVTIWQGEKIIEIYYITVRTVDTALYYTPV